MPSLEPFEEEERNAAIDGEVVLDAAAAVDDLELVGREMTTAASTASKRIQDEFPLPPYIQAHLDDTYAALDLIETTCFH